MSEQQKKGESEALSTPPGQVDSGKPLGTTELYNPLIGLVLAILAMTLASFAHLLWPEYQAALLLTQALLATICFYLVFKLMRCVKNRLLTPLANLRDWAQRMRAGNLSARIPQPKEGEFSALTYDINKLGETLRSLTREMDERVNRQTISLQRKTRSLEILYDVAARSNSARDLNELLSFFLDTLTEIVYAHAGTVHLLTDDNQMQLVASVGLDESAIEKTRMVPLEHCMCAQDFSSNMILCQNKFKHCQNLVGELVFTGDKLENIAIPLRYRNHTLGIYNLFVEKLGLSEREDIKDILTNIGQHLSIAIKKSRWDEEANRISIMEERAMLAHELHDSLAQTLASLRFRVNMLQQELVSGSDGLANANNEVELLKTGLDEANFELRELLSHFRIRMDERGLIPATEDLIDRFTQETGIHAFFQNECSNLSMPPMLEVHILHIIQEALSNIRKHSNARHVRVLMRCQHDEYFHVLIEDDGIGIDSDLSTSLPGEHVGMTIMRERADRIGARLTIESEPGEGTRVELELDSTSSHADKPEP